MRRILVVEDEEHLALGLQFNLRAEDYDVTVVGDGESALQLLLAGKEPDRDSAFDLVVLDVMLPGKDGFMVASELRSANHYIPVLMLTARGRPEDVLNGFAAGADDYLPKPFDLPILLARINGLLRRRSWLRNETSRNEQSRNAAHEAGEAPTPTGEAKIKTEAAPYEFDGRTIDFLGQQLQAKGTTHPLTLMEVELLRYLIKNAGKPVSRKAILEEVWGLHEDTDTRAIDNFIVRLRKYLEDDPAHPKYLQTMRGVGYRFVPSGK